MSGEKNNIVAILATIGCSLFYLSRQDILSERLVTLGVLTVVGLCLIAFGGFKNSFKCTVSYFGIWWGLLYVILAIDTKPEMNTLIGVLEWLPLRISYMGVRYNTAMGIALAALVVVHIFMKKYDIGLIFCLLKYALGYFLLVRIANLITYMKVSFLPFVMILFLLTDVRNYLRPPVKSCFLRCILLCVLMILLCCIYPRGEVVARLHKLFFMEDLWAWVAVVLALCGVLLLTEKQECPDAFKRTVIPDTYVRGAGFIIAAMYIALCAIWPQFYVSYMVYASGFLAVIVFEYVCIFQEARSTGSKFAGRVGFVSGFIIMLLVIMGVGRTLNTNPRYLYLLVAVLVVRKVCINIVWKSDRYDCVMHIFWGVAGAILLFAFNRNVFSLDVLRSSSQSLILLGGLCGFWSILTKKIYAFNAQEVEADYRKILVFQTILLCMCYTWLLILMLRGI